MVRYWSSRQTVDASGHPFEYSAGCGEPLQGRLADAASYHLTTRDKTPLVLSQLLKAGEG
jgi:hypothetical protein